MVIKFQYPRVSPGDQPLTKEPEESGYEIEVTPEKLKGKGFMSIMAYFCLKVVSSCPVFRRNFSLSKAS